MIGRRSGGCRRDVDHRRTRDLFAGLPALTEPLTSDFDEMTMMLESDSTVVSPPGRPGRTAPLSARADVGPAITREQGVLVSCAAALACANVGHDSRVVAIRRIPPGAAAKAEEAAALGRRVASEVVTVGSQWDWDNIVPVHEAPWPDCQLGVPAARRLPLRPGQVILARDAEIAGKL